MEILTCDPRYMYNEPFYWLKPRKTRPCLTERLLMGRKESNQTNNIMNHPNQMEESISIQRVRSILHIKIETILIFHLIIAE